MRYKITKDKEGYHLYLKKKIKWRKALTTSSIESCYVALNDYRLILMSEELIEEGIL